MQNVAIPKQLTKPTSNTNKLNLSNQNKHYAQTKPNTISPTATKLRNTTKQIKATKQKQTLNQQIKLTQENKQTQQSITNNQS